MQVANASVHMSMSICQQGLATCIDMCLHMSQYVHTCRYWLSAACMSEFMLNACLYGLRGKGLS